MKKLTDKKIRIITRKLDNKCKMTGCQDCYYFTYGGCPQDKAHFIRSWWTRRKS